MTSSQDRFFKTLALAAARAAQEKKAEDVLLLHVRSICSFADYLLVASVHSPTHLKAVQEHVEELLEGLGARLNHRDGRLSAAWRVLDYGGLLVHLMQPAARQFYALEKLFDGAKPVGLP